MPDFEDQQTEVTVTLDGGKVTTMAQAMTIIAEMLGSSIDFSDSLKLTLKVKTFADVGDAPERIRKLFKRRRGIKATVTTKVTVKDIEGDERAEHWQSTMPLESLTPSI